MEEPLCPTCSGEYVVQVTYECKHSVCLECDIHYRQKGGTTKCYLCGEPMHVFSYASKNTIMIERLTGALIPVAVNLGLTTVAQLHYIAAQVLEYQYDSVRLVYKGRQLPWDSSKGLWELGIREDSHVKVHLVLRGD